MLRFVFRLIMLAVFVAIAGFVVFVFALPAVTAVQAAPETDAIVVLTGGGGSRIRAASTLLAGGHGQRLLISGVNPTVHAADIQKLFELDETMMQCCVDLDYRARNTVGNAGEIAAWSRRHHYHRLLVVTSTYHMPRALNELRAAMPGAQLIPFAVRPPPRAGLENWRRIVAEYIKYALTLGRDKLHDAGLGGGSA